MLRQREPLLRRAPVCEHHIPLYAGLVRATLPAGILVAHLLADELWWFTYYQPPQCLSVMQALALHQQASSLALIQYSTPSHSSIGHFEAVSYAASSGALDLHVSCQHRTGGNVWQGATLVPCPAIRGGAPGVPAYGRFSQLDNELAPLALDDAPTPVALRRAASPAEASPARVGSSAQATIRATPACQLTPKRRRLLAPDGTPGEPMQPVTSSAIAACGDAVTSSAIAACSDAIGGMDESEMHRRVMDSVDGSDAAAYARVSCSPGPPASCAHAGGLAGCGRAHRHSAGLSDASASPVAVLKPCC